MQQARSAGACLQSISEGERTLRIAALIVAAGRGTRAAGQGAGPKQYAAIGGRTVLCRAIGAFAKHPAVDEVKVVIHADDAQWYAGAASESGSAKLSEPAIGGASRQASVLNGLEALVSTAPDMVLIHDAARPFVSAKTISNVIAALSERPAALAALAVTDTLKRASDVRCRNGDCRPSRALACADPAGFSLRTHTRRPPKGRQRGT